MAQITKKALEASLKHLLLQKPLPKITIQDLTDDCGISRMTFYYHFKKMRKRLLVKIGIMIAGRKGCWIFLKQSGKISLLSLMFTIR